MAQAAAVCQHPISPTETCGILPIGRCAYCKRAFCLTHQGRSRDAFGQLIPYVDVCVLCVAQTPAEVDRAERERYEAEKWKREQEVKAAQAYFTSGAARHDLQHSGAQLVQLYQVRHKKVYKQSWFDKLWAEIADTGVHSKLVAETITMRGWILGTYRWAYARHAGDTNLPQEPIREDFLTALVEDVPANDRDVMGDYVRKDGLYPVRPASRGYEITRFPPRHELDNFYADEAKFPQDKWIEAMQTVKQLAGLSTP